MVMMAEMRDLIVVIMMLVQAVVVLVREVLLIFTEDTVVKVSILAIYLEEIWGRMDGLQVEAEVL